VTLHRAFDPEFRARIEAARAEAKQRIVQARTEGGGMAPPAGWGALDGEELVVRGSNGRRTQIARARLKQWSPRAEARFLGVLAATCNVKAACAAVGLTAVSAYAHAKRWQGFAERWRAAVEIGYIRIEAQLLAGLGANPFSGGEVDAEVAMPAMTVAEALQRTATILRRIGIQPGLRIVNAAEEIKREISREDAETRRGSACRASGSFLQTARRHRVTRGIPSSRLRVNRFLLFSRPRRRHHGRLSGWRALPAAAQIEKQRDGIVRELRLRLREQRFGLGQRTLGIEHDLEILRPRLIA
jgi:hypothetical protein